MRLQILRRVFADEQFAAGGFLRINRKLVSAAEEAFGVEIDVEVRPMHRKRVNDEMRLLGGRGVLQRRIERQRRTDRPPVAQTEGQTSGVDIQRPGFPDRSFAMGSIPRSWLRLGWAVAASVSEWMLFHSLTLAATAEIKGTGGDWHRCDLVKCPGVCSEDVYAIFPAAISMQERALVPPKPWRRRMLAMV
jgi:hypothetical protein